MRYAFGLIIARLGETIAHLVCIENPSRVINGQDIHPVSVYNQQWTWPSLSGEADR